MKSIKYKHDIIQSVTENNENRLCMQSNKSLL